MSDDDDDSADSWLGEVLSSMMMAFGFSWVYMMDE